METQVQTMARKQRDKWEILQCEPIWSRGTCRLQEFKKTFPEDLNVTVLDQETNEYKPLLLRSGRPLRASEVLPERADLALDEDGHLLDQMRFEHNYRKYLETFVLPPGSEIELEPVPNVVAFVNRKPDVWSESRGMVEIDYDPQLSREFVPQKRIDSEGNEASDMKALLAKLVEMQTSSSNPVPSGGVELAEATTSAEPEGKERAPCGAYVVKGYVSQHKVRCRDGACGDDSVNSADSAA